MLYLSIMAILALNVATELPEHAQTIQTTFPVLLLDRNTALEFFEIEMARNDSAVDADGNVLSIRLQDIILRGMTLEWKMVFGSGDHAANAADFHDDPYRKLSGIFTVSSTANAGDYIAQFDLPDAVKDNLDERWETFQIQIFDPATGLTIKDSAGNPVSLTYTIWDKTLDTRMKKDGN